MDTIRRNQIPEKRLARIHRYGMAGEPPDALAVMPPSMVFIDPANPKFWWEATSELPMKTCVVIAGIVCLASITVAQDAPPANVQPAPVAAATAPATTATPSAVVLREGTRLELKLAQNLSSKTAVDDDPVNFVLAEDLVVDNVVVARKGAFATGSVSHTKRAGMLGRAGELSIRLSHLKCGTTRVKLRGSQGKEGQGKEGAVVALTVLFGPIGLIKHGKNVDVKEGAPLTAYVDQDYTLPRTGNAAD
jgi:hypothetical protein